MAALLVDVAEKVSIQNPYGEARSRLKQDIQKIADGVQMLDPNRPAWKPLLDSRRIVRTVLVLETLFPFKFPPDKLVKKGGYNDVDEAVDDIIRRHKKLTEEKNKPKRGRI